MTAPFDPARVSAVACANDPSLSPDLAQQLAAEAWAHLQQTGAPDAPELSRHLMAAHGSVGASECNAVATAVVDFCESAGLP